MKQEAKLLEELKAAHLIIRNALNVMNNDQKAEWGRLNAFSRCDGDGITRANERETLINKTEGVAK